MLQSGKLLPDIVGKKIAAGVRDVVAKCAWHNKSVRSE
jgi:hypothetical protein